MSGAAADPCRESWEVPIGFGRGLTTTFPALCHEARHVRGDPGCLHFAHKKGRDGELLTKG